MRKFIAALGLMLAVLFLLTRFAELNSMLTVLQRGQVGYLGLALAAQLAWILNLGAFYQSVYRMLGMPQRLTYITRLATAGFFMTIVAPSAGFSAMAVYYEDARRRGLPAARVTLAAVIYVWFEFIGTFGMVLLGMAALAESNDLHWAEFTASLVLLAGAVGIGLLLYLGMRSATELGRMLAFLTRTVNAAARPFIHRDYLSEQRAHEFSFELAEAIGVLRRRPHGLAWPLFYTFINKALLVAVLGFCFLAFRVPVGLGRLVAGQSIAHMFLIVSPTPAGIGFVEGILALALNSIGVPLGDATIVTLAYRAFSFWLLFFVGMVMFRTLHHEKKRAPQISSPGNAIEPE